MERLFQSIRRIEEFVLAWSILAIAGLAVANVICRALLGFSLAFAGELSQFLMIAVTFVGLSYAAGHGRHIRMTALYDQLSPHWRKSLSIVISGSTCLLLLLLAVLAIRYIATVHFLGAVSPVLRVPLYLVYSIVPWGLALASAQYGLTTARNLRSRELYLSFDRRDEYASKSGDTE
jgi:C4-dicarboxylate transporter DctQ subunit